MAMNRYLFAVALIAMGGLSYACGSSAPGPSATKVIGISFYTNTIPLYAQIRQGMEAEAKVKGVQLKFSYSNNDAATQSSQIADFVTQKVSLILCSPVSVSALVPAYNQARAAGIPVISVANKVPDANEDAFIGQDWSFVGRAQVDDAAKALNGKGKIAVITGPPVIDFVKQSVQGINDELGKNPGMTIVAQAVDPDLSQNGGLDQANNILTAHPDVNAILASTDDIALGAVQALQEHHIAPGKVFVAGLDGEPRAVESIKNQQGLSFTISVKGVTWGKQSIDVAVDWLNGKKPSTHRVDSAYQIVDAANAATLTPDQLN
jgi:ABC-type sugar transport system substrate-binding protein